MVVNNSDKSTFVGYHDLHVDTPVLKYRKVKAKGKEQYQFVLQETPFYAESGGQVGDKGILQFDDEQVKVVDTKKENNLIVHFAESLPKGYYRISYLQQLILNRD